MGRVAAEKWAEQIAPEDMAAVDARNAAAQSKTQARTVKITGATAGAPQGLDSGELLRKLLRSRTRRKGTLCAIGCIDPVRSYPAAVSSAAANVQAFE